MPSKLSLALAFPVQFLMFAYAFTVQLVLIAIQRLLLPTWPQYQPLRTQFQRAYQSSGAMHFPEFIHRLPAEYEAHDATPVAGSGWSGYLIPGRDATILSKAQVDSSYRVVLFAHGGGYSRGTARMYVPYMQRWSAASLDRPDGMKLVFLSVEYTLSTRAHHPVQRDEFLQAYDYLIQQGISHRRIVFMGDSAGGGICINAALHCLQSKTMPQPAASVLISPWLDMCLPSYEGGNQAVLSDYFVAANEVVPTMRDMFLGPHRPNDPQANPLYRPIEQIRGLNPQLIFAGGAEFALADSKEWEKLCVSAQVPNRLTVAWAQLHVWALGSRFIEPKQRQQTDREILDWIFSWSS